MAWISVQEKSLEQGTAEAGAAVDRHNRVEAQVRTGMEAEERKKKMREEKREGSETQEKRNI